MGTRQLEDAKTAHLHARLAQTQPIAKPVLQMLSMLNLIQPAIYIVMKPISLVFKEYAI